MAQGGLPRRGALSLQELPPRLRRFKATSILTPSRLKRYISFFRRDTETPPKVHPGVLDRLIKIDIPANSLTSLNVLPHGLEMFSARVW